MSGERKKVLFLRFSSLGDIIFANYSAMRIKEKHPEFHLTWMTDSMYAGIAIPCTPASCARSRG